MSETGSRLKDPITAGWEIHVSAAAHDITSSELTLFARTVHELAGSGRSAREIRSAMSENLVTLLRADHVASYVWDDGKARFGEPVAINQDPAHVERYVRWFQFRDPVPARLRHLRRATLVDDVMPRRELERTEFYNDFLRPDGLHHGLNMFLFDDTGRDVGDLRVWRARGRPAFDARELALLDSLGPLLQQALVQAGQSTPDVLTPRERQVCDLVARGLADKQIASTLGISFGTVRTHVSNSMAKLGCTNRAALAVSALRLVR